MKRDKKRKDLNKKYKEELKEVKEILKGKQEEVESLQKKYECFVQEVITYLHHLSFMFYLKYKTVKVLIFFTASLFHASMERDLITMKTIKE